MNPKNKNTITVLCAGAWGTAIAQVLAENNNRVKLWCYEQEVAYDIQTKQKNSRYISPDITLSKNIIPTCNLAQAVENTDWIFEAVPVKFLRNIIQKIKNLDTNNNTQEATWVMLSKGMEDKTHLLPTQILEDIYGHKLCTAVLGGPSFSKDLLEKQFTGVQIASKNETILNELETLLSTPYLRTLKSSDTTGVQIGGAFKNVIALAVGLAQGAGYKDNTIAYILTQGLKEMAHLASHFNGQAETIYGLSGLGDMILSCTGTLSKNLKSGRLLAQGRSIEDLHDVFAALPEGLNTIKSIYQILEKKNLSLSLCKATYEIIFKNKPVSSLLV